MKIRHSKRSQVQTFCLTGLIGLGFLAITSTPVISRDDPVLPASIADSIADGAESTTDTGTVDSMKDNPHENQLRTDMLAMSGSVLKLFAFDNMTNLDDAERQKRILQELDKLEKTARILINDVEIKNYSIRSPFMGSFLHDVGMAREFALMDPPDYRPSTGLIKSCLLCHKSLDSGQ